MWEFTQEMHQNIRQSRFEIETRDYCVYVYMCATYIENAVNFLHKMFSSVVFPLRLISIEIIQLRTTIQVVKFCDRTKIE